MAYYKLDHMEQIKLKDNYVVPRFKDCSFLNYMKENNYFTDINENDSLEDIIKRYEATDFSNREIKNKIDYEYDLLKIYRQYIEKTKVHLLEHAEDESFISFKNNLLDLCPLLYEMLRNGYFHNGSKWNLSMQSIESLINIYENETYLFIQNGDSIFDGETYDKYYSFSKKYNDFKDVDYWENVFSKIDKEFIRVESIIQNDSHTACKLKYSIDHTYSQSIEFYFGANSNEEDAIDTFYQNVKQELDAQIKGFQEEINNLEDIKNKLPIVEK